MVRRGPVIEQAGACISVASLRLGWAFVHTPPPPLVQRMQCPTSTSVRTVFEDIINYGLNHVPGFRIEVFRQKDWGNEGL